MRANDRWAPPEECGRFCERYDIGGRFSPSPEPGVRSIRSKRRPRVRAGGTGMQILEFTETILYLVELSGLRARGAGYEVCSRRGYIMRKMKTVVSDRGIAIWGAMDVVATGWRRGGVAFR